MATLEPVGRAAVGGAGRFAGVTTLPAVPPNFLAIAFGLGGLATVWRAATTAFGAPAAIADALYSIAACVYLVLVVAVIGGLVSRPRSRR